MRGQLLVCDLPSFTYILQLSYSFESRSAVVVSWKIVYIYIVYYCIYIYTIPFNDTMVYLGKCLDSADHLFHLGAVGFLKKPLQKPSGTQSKSYWKWPSRNSLIVDKSPFKMVDLSIAYVNVYQRVINQPMGDIYDITSAAKGRGRVLSRPAGRSTRRFASLVNIREAVMSRIITKNVLLRPNLKRFSPKKRLTMKNGSLI